MPNSRRSLHQHRFAVAALALVFAFTVSSCGEDSTPKDSKAELKAELAKLSKFHQDDFHAGDKNGDLRLEDSELDVMFKEDFEDADANGDGEINGTDIRMAFDEQNDNAANVKRGEEPELDVDASLAFMDLNKDGRVPLEEYLAHVERHFMVQMDKNEDGDIDPVEMTNFYKHHKVLEEQ